MKYSVAIRKIGALRDTLNQLQNYDNSFDEAFTRFHRKIGVLPVSSKNIDLSPAQKKRATKAIVEAVDQLDRNMRATVRDVRAAKDRLKI